MGDEKPAKKTRNRRERELSARELRFAMAYFETGNATEAYRAAGYPERPDHSTWTLAWRVLRNVKVREYIRELRQEALDANRITCNKIIQTLGFIAFADRLGMLDDRGSLLPKSEWPKDVRACLEGIEVEELFETVSEPGSPRRKERTGHLRKVRTAKRTEALKLLMAHKGMLGSNGEANKPPPAPLVISGDANPDVL